MILNVGIVGGKDLEDISKMMMGLWNLGQSSACGIVAIRKEPLNMKNKERALCKHLEKKKNWSCGIK